jgi:SAM-dependent methyltransferase
MDKDTRLLYGPLSWIWPIMSPPEDYVEEATLYLDYLRLFAEIPAKTLLDLGCGGGHNDWTLKNNVEVTGVDISKEMLALAKKLNPECRYLEGDMRKVRLGELFDVVLLHDSVNYMLTPEDLQAAFQTCHEHLKPGGAMLTVIERIPERFKQHGVSYKTRTKGDIELTYMEHIYDPNLEDTTYESTFIYLIRKDGKLESHVDRHLCGIFPPSSWMQWMEEAGFRVHQRPFTHSTYLEGQWDPMLIGVKALSKLTVAE